MPNLKKIIETAEKEFEEKFVPLKSGFSVAKDWTKNLEGTTANYMTLKSFLSAKISEAVKECLEGVKLERRIGIGFMPLENEALIKNVRANLEHNEKESEKIGFNSAVQDLEAKIAEIINN